MEVRHGIGAPLSQAKTRLKYRRLFEYGKVLTPNDV